MIHTVSLYHPTDDRWINESPINQWLLNHVGMCANIRWGESISESMPWAVAHYPSRLAYHFYKESDALMFSLRWA